MAAISRALTRYRNIIGEWSKGSRGKEKWNVEEKGARGMEKGARGMGKGKYRGPGGGSKKRGGVGLR